MQTQKENEKSEDIRTRINTEIGQRWAPESLVGSTEAFRPQTVGTRAIGDFMKWRDLKGLC